jgi:hypothetical protein
MALNTSTSQRIRIPVAPGVAVGWVLIGALVLVFPDDLDSVGMAITVVATTITVLLVHFVAEMFLGHNALHGGDISFGELFRREALAMLWMAMWVIPTLVPALLYGFDLIDHAQALTATSRTIQVLAAVLGFLVGWSRGRSWWASALIGIAFVLVISFALLIEAITHTFTSALH